jgi:ribosomal RNA-processing protein 1
MLCSGFNATILSTSGSVTSSQPGSLIMHFCDIYLQEISKVSQGKLPVDMLTAFLQPFIYYLAEEENGRLRNKVENDVFYYLMKQSDAGIELEEMRRAWNAVRYL